MLHWFHKHLKSVGRATLAMAGLLWVIAAGAPCVMAQTPDPASVHCPEHMKQAGDTHTAMADCGPVTALNCQLPDTNTPLVAGLGDFAMAPVLLITLPVSAMLSASSQPPRPDFFLPDLHSPPLHIRHLTLIL